MNKLLIASIVIVLAGCQYARTEKSQITQTKPVESTTPEERLKKSGLVSHWDFGSDSPLEAKGKNPYILLKANDSVGVGKIKGVKCLELQEGGYLYIPRKDCPALDFHSENSNFTIVAKINRREKSYRQCEAIAGMWNETEKKRQYYLFLNLMQKESGDQVCGHVSYVGGPTPGHKWAMDASIGSTPIDYNEWVTVAFSFDGKEAKSYLNGKLDSREGLNPYLFEHGLYNGGEDGSDFTVGAVDRLGEMGNYFVGGMAQLAVFNRALTDKELEELVF